MRGRPESKDRMRLKGINMPTEMIDFYEYQAQLQRRTFSEIVRMALEEVMNRKGGKKATSGR